MRNKKSEFLILLTLLFLTRAGDGILTYKITSENKIMAIYSSTYPKVAVQWLNHALRINKYLLLADSEVLLNCHLRKLQTVSGKFTKQQIPTE